MKAEFLAQKKRRARRPAVVELAIFVD